MGRPWESTLNGAADRHQDHSKNVWPADSVSQFRIKSGPNHAERLGNSDTYSKTEVEDQGNTGPSHGIGETLHLTLGHGVCKQPKFGVRMSRLSYAQTGKLKSAACLNLFLRIFPEMIWSPSRASAALSTPGWFPTSTVHSSSG